MVILSPRTGVVGETRATAAAASWVLLLGLVMVALASSSSAAEHKGVMGSIAADHTVVLKSDRAAGTAYNSQGNSYQILRTAPTVQPRVQPQSSTGGSPEDTRSSKWLKMVRHKHDVINRRLRQQRRSHHVTAVVNSKQDQPSYPRTYPNFDNPPSAPVLQTQLRSNTSHLEAFPDPNSYPSSQVYPISKTLSSSPFSHRSSSYPSFPKIEDDRGASRTHRNSFMRDSFNSSVNDLEHKVVNTLDGRDAHPGYYSGYNGSSTVAGRLASVPRLMLELYAAHERGRAPPYNADTVRSFPPLNLGTPTTISSNNSSGRSGSREDDNRRHEGREASQSPAADFPLHHISSSSHEFPSAAGPSSALSSSSHELPSAVGPSPSVSSGSYSFSFKVSWPDGERVRNLLLRVRTLVRREHSPVGLERRMRVLVWRREGAGGGGMRARAVEVARNDVYLHNHAWQTFNIRPALRHMSNQTSKFLNISIEIERAFSTVGDPGELELDLTPDVNLQPLVLLYTSQLRTRRTPQPHLRSTRSISENDWDADEDLLEDEHDLESPVGVMRGDPGRKSRRAGRRRRAKNSCKRKPLKVDFASIGWDQWVIAPLDYEAFQCSGKCFYPLASHLSPTKHAVIQTLMHSRSTERARRACCVPTLLGPMSLLYMEDNVPTYKKDYGDMVALECGCR